MAKVVCEKRVNGEQRLVVVTTPGGGNQGLYVKSIVGAGNPFWLWPSIPSGTVIGCDFTNAPVCTDDPSQNNALIAAITVAPEDVLTYL